MFKKVRRFLIGRPLKNEALNDQKLGVLWGLPILSSDAISSVAYAGQEMLIYLIPAIGILAFGQLSILSAAIIGLLILLTLSYRQTIECYPSGGGAYIVAKENISLIAGVLAGAALSVDYILTVAVSVSSGVEQIASAFKFIAPHSVAVSVILVLLLTIGNLRGIRESSRIFGLPAYAFIFGILYLIVAGFIKLKGGWVPVEPTLPAVIQPIGLILLLRAFSGGCTALTGVEAVSNAVPNFKNPPTKYAKYVLYLLSLIILVLFGGTSLLANYIHVDPTKQGALLIAMAEQVFGKHFMYYYITTTTFIILVMAANTAYSGFPMLISVIARDGHAPKQLAMRGDRLSYDNGIWLLSAVAIILIIAFKAKVSSLIGLYAIGVFISFTLSQSGMFLRWIRLRDKNWVVKAVINGFGAIVTTIVVCIIAVFKFNEGAWIVVILIPILIWIMLRIRKHYSAIYKQLKITDEELLNIDVDNTKYRNRVIVPIENINKSSIRALRYACTISNDVTAFCIAIDEENADELKRRYKQIKCSIPIVVKYSPFRKILEPLLKFIDSVEYDYNKGDIVTVILPEFSVSTWWQKFLHNNTGFFIRQELLKHKHIVVSVIPLQLKKDNTVLKN